MYVFQEQNPDQLKIKTTAIADYSLSRATTTNLLFICHTSYDNANTHRDRSASATETTNLERRHVELHPHVMAADPEENRGLIEHRLIPQLGAHEHNDAVLWCLTCGRLLRLDALDATVKPQSPAIIEM